MTESSRADLHFAVLGDAPSCLPIVMQGIDHGYRPTIVGVGADELAARRETTVAAARAGLRRIPLFASVGEMLAHAPLVDAAIITDSVPLDELIVIAESLLSAGVDVVAIAPVLLDGSGPAAVRLHRAARRGGSSFLATGAEDPWSIHLPLAIAGVSQNVTRVMLEEEHDLADLDESGASASAGAGLDEVAFARWRRETLRDLAPQIVPLRELALALGFVPGLATTEIEPLRVPSPQFWRGADRLLDAGDIAGAQFHSFFDTECGVRFERIVSHRLNDWPDDTSRSITVFGDITVSADLPAVDSAQQAALAAVRRLADVIAAEPGALRARDLAMPRYDAASPAAGPVARRPIGRAAFTRRARS